MRIVDTTTKKITTINIYDENGVEFSNDFYEAGSMDYNEDLDVFYGDVTYMLEQLHNFINCEGDFDFMESAPSGITYTVDNE